MKTFSIRDLIRYNNPCKSCGNISDFCLRSYNDAYVGSAIRPIVDPVNKKVHFTLQTLYEDRLVIAVNCATNEFELISNSDAKKLFKEYCNLIRLVAETCCRSCGTTIRSDDLSFTDKFIKSTKLFSEEVHVVGDNHKFTITTYHFEKKTQIVADILNKVTPITPMFLETRMLPLHRFKNKQELLDKLRVLMTFS